MPRPATAKPPLTPEQWKLVVDNEALAKWATARAIKRGIVRCDEETALNYAHDGLISAARSFDASKGFRFSTYATRAIHNWLLRCAKVNRRRVVMPEFGWSILTSPDDTRAEAEVRELRQRVVELIDTLDRRTRAVLIHRFGLFGAEEKTLVEVGQKLGITRERVRQIEKAALETLADLLDADADVQRDRNGKRLGHPTKPRRRSYIRGLGRRAARNARFMPNLSD